MSFIDRWSRRKREVTEPAAPPTREPLVNDAPANVAPLTEPPVQSPAGVAPPADLPDIDTLTPDSDFTAFMRAGVSAVTRAQAMRKLFADPHFNLMDGLDVYIDDYNKPDPLPADWLGKLEHAKDLLFREQNTNESRATDSLTDIAAAPTTAEPTLGDTPDSAADSSTDSSSSHD
ncbi:MAG TPA: DUF3306 domain-containing protein [Burkholderiaceae bacterium]|nr:DUF3306 domain-containing protein [Burkholderiaceae bacterium]